MKEIQYVFDNAPQSICNHLYFSRFVKNIEFNFDEANMSASNLKHYKKLWMNLEILNAVVLDDWEQYGYPSEWQDCWERLYKKEAYHLVKELCEWLEQQK